MKSLTPVAVKNLKPGATLADTTPYRGLRVTANKSGSKSWVYRFRVGEKLRQITLGHFPDMSLVEAREAFLEAKKTKAPPQPKELAAPPLQDLTVGEMVERYLAERVEKDRTPKAARETRRLLEGDLGALNKRPVSSIARLELHEHIRAIADRAPDVARVFRVELARAWRYASNVGRTDAICPINSDLGGKLSQGKRERWLSKDELKLLLPWTHHYSRTVEDALLMTLHTGLRSGEVCRLHDAWLAEEPDGWWLTIPAADMKKHHSDHRVPLVGKALSVAMKRKGSGFWFPGKTAKHIDQKVLGVEVFAKSGRSDSPIYAGKPVCPVTEPWAPNDLRKTARSHLAAMGCPYEVGEAVLHHKLPGVAGTYNQYRYDAEKREWLTRLGEYFDRLADEGRAS